MENTRDATRPTHIAPYLCSWGEEISVFDNVESDKISSLFGRVILVPPPLAREEMDWYRDPPTIQVRKLSVRYLIRIRLWPPTGRLSKSCPRGILAGRGVWAR